MHIIRRYLLSLCCLFVAACSGSAPSTAPAASDTVASPAGSPATEEDPVSPPPPAAREEAEPEPAPVPGMVSDPAPTPESEPVPSSALEQVPGTVADPTPVPDPTPAPTPDPVPDPVPDPTPVPTPDPDPTPDPVPAAAPFTTAVTIAGQPGGCGYASGTGTEARFSAPQHIAADGDTLYIADYNGQIFRVTVDPDTGVHTSQRIATLQYLYRPFPEYSVPKASEIIDLQPVGNALYVLASDDIWPQDHPNAELDYQLWKLPLPIDTLLTEYPAAPLQQFQAARAIVNIEGVIHVVAWGQSGVALFAIQEEDGTATSTKIRDLPSINPYGAAYSAATKTLYLPSQPGSSGQIGKGRVWTVDMAGPEHALTPLPNLVLNYPHRISVSPSGTELLILDTYASQTLTRYNLAAQTAATILAGGPIAADGTMGDGGTARHGKAYSVLAIGDGRFYLGNDCALRLGDATQIRTVAGHVAGTRTNAGFVDGPGAAARFSSLEQMVASPDGTMVYVVDRNPNTPTIRPVLRRIAISETTDGPPIATVLPDAIPLVHPAIGTVNVAELAIIPDPDHPRLFVTSNSGSSRDLFYVNVDTHSLHRINLIGADGQRIVFSRIAFDRHGRLFRPGWRSGKIVTPDIIVTGLNTAMLDASSEYHVTDDTVRIIAFDADPEHHLERGPGHTITYNTIADTFLLSGNGATGNADNNSEFRLTETGDPAQPFATQWLRSWHCDDFPGWSPLLTSAAFTADGLYSPARQRPIGDWQTVINRCRSTDDTTAVVTMSGSGEIGVKDGVGALGGWNRPIDMVFDNVHQRFYLIDPAERVLRILQ